ncbi:methyltransferase domain-containing protein [Alicyclobacillus fastidiosus]|uniref:Methyltransferase domain-containing protein n=1 Tax=Alicyclobacillus fastidiosus TaxID=392011 RepID=A0ABY6ZE63_9BACL|nr:class I SAM-dependent methyltransferase [Alicyclobacillus fastidiosus]WAH41098.1 methyltransferase domain-containing protein [Alicyclobacillus fastidiosus]GMA62654.1 SAM-dependent methyltransferase [Alicyclobacillus fastidiosus]
MEHNDVKKTVQDQFGRAASAYVESDTHAHGTDLALLVEWLAPAGTALALDIATGGGHVAKSLAPYVQSVFATDLTKSMLEAAREHITQEKLHNVQFVLADAESLPFLDQTFDIVTCRIAAHHFPNPNAFVEEVSRVLKPGGAFLFIDNIAPEEPHLASFLNEFERLRDNGHVRCLSLSEWTQLMESTGLHVEKQRVRKKPFEFRPWVRRMAQSEHQIEEVERFFVNATAEQRQYFDLTFANGQIASFRTDECMMLCKKAP